MTATVDSAVADPQRIIAELQRRLDEALAERDAAQERETATVEVLQVINASPGDLAPVWDAMLKKATRLCDAETAHLLRFDGTNFSRAASLGVPPGFDEILPIGQPMAHVITKDSVPFRMLAARRTIPVLDLREDESVHAGAPAETQAVAEGIRSLLFVPLLREGEVVGCFVMHRMAVRAFTDKEIALIENFAAQAVIAMENARLITETREALEKQTATAEILGVISSSPTDVQPTFEAIATRAAILCEAVNAAVFRFDGSLIHMGAMHGVTEAEREASDSVFPLPPGRSSATTRAIETREIVHIPDTRADPEYVSALHVFGTALSVPMLRDGLPMGAITVTRYTAEPFAQAQIELLKTFADQAVIAIETVRLFTELNQRTRDLEESLEYQTATSDVLKVISRSTFDIQPVLDTLAETAARLCDAGYTAIYRRDGEAYRMAAVVAFSPETMEAALKFQAFLEQHPLET